MTDNDSSNTGKIALVCHGDNPLAEIVNLIPWEFVQIDPKLLDAVANLLIKPLKTWPSNSVVMLLFETLHNAEFVHLHSITNELGSSYYIKRI